MPGRDMRTRSPYGKSSILAWGTFIFGTLLRDDITAAKPLSQISQIPPFHAVIYTLDLLIPVISLGERTAWIPHRAAQWWAFGFTIVGWLLTTALVAGLAVRRQ